jgi:hypothetical protein
VRQLTDEDVARLEASATSYANRQEQYKAELTQIG